MPSPPLNIHVRVHTTSEAHVKPIIYFRDQKRDQVHYTDTDQKHSIKLMCNIALSK